MISNLLERNFMSRGQTLVHKFSPLEKIKDKRVKSIHEFIQKPKNILNEEISAKLNVSN